MLQAENFESLRKASSIPTKLLIKTKSSNFNTCKHVRIHLYEEKYEENERRIVTTGGNFSGDYPKLLVFSIGRKVPADKPALFQW